jgi:hypothetical protein
VPTSTVRGSFSSASRYSGKVSQSGAGNIFDAFHQADQPFVLVGLGGRKADAAIAHHHGSDAVPARGGHFLVPGGLTVIMRMDVDKAGRDQMPLRVDFLGGIAGDFAHLGDQAILDGDIAGEAVLAGAIDDGPVANDQIICGHVCAPLSTEEGSTMQPMSPAQTRWPGRASSLSAAQRGR